MEAATPAENKTTINRANKNMELKEILAQRRSIRRFIDRRVPQAIVENLLNVALAAPSSHNSRSTRLLVVDDPTVVARMAAMRDNGSEFLACVPLAIVVMGDKSKTDLWEVNAAIAATLIQLTAVDEGLASCWVQIARRPRVKAEPDGERAADYLRTFLPIPDECEPLCAIALGYSDFQPAPLPGSDDRARIIRLK